jgi:mono/diheme cytochrome c family protein
MSGSKITVDEEQKSYSAVFLLAVGLLLAGAIWAVWDDNISRRPWKKYQVEFSNLQIDRAREELEAEEQRLANDPEYQELQRQLAEANESLENGENARQLGRLAAEREPAQVRVDEEDLNLRVVKSKLEEAWYEFDHAVLTKHSTEGPRDHLEELQKEQTEIEENLAQAHAAVQKIDNEVAEIRSVVLGLQDKQRDLEQQQERLQQRLDALVLPLGPLQLPPIPKIHQVVLNEFDRNAYDQPVARVDRCQSCHSGIDKAGFENDEQPFATHPNRDPLLTKHPPDKFGCTPCHGGQGAAVNSVQMAHGEVRFWEQPLRRGDEVQAGCISCHTDLRMNDAETIARGEYLFEELGCVGCHLVEGYGELARVGPYLRRLDAKVRPEWLVGWVEKPHEFRPRSRMPNFMFDRSEATAISAYLLDSSKEESDEWLERHGMPAGVDPTNSAQVARGKLLVDSLGCRGCHGFAADESPASLGANKDVAPNLARVAEKTSARWLFHWLTNPRGYSPDSRMPSLRLSDEEAADIASYLLTLGKPPPVDETLRATIASPETVKTGEALVRKYGCPGCHNIAGMETESRIGVELSTFGSKILEELFFGNHTDIPHTWRDWTYNKIKEPRTYETERIEQLMPQFDLEDEDIEALLIFLSSREEGHAPGQYHPTDIERERTLVEGRRVAARYNCVGCHVIEKRGGAILARYEESPTLAPPILNGEGAKVQPNWLFGFLKHPVPLRPWLHVRMPTFSLSDEETNALVKYFLAQEKVDVPFVYVNQAAIPEEYVEAGRLLASPDYFNCYSCHQQGDKKPEGPKEGWAPDLAMAKSRLNPDWIVRWLRNPQALQPGTKMPSFYDFEDPEPDGPDDVLGGSDDEQVEALRDYILTLYTEPKPVLAEAPAVEVLEQPAEEDSPPAEG